MSCPRLARLSSIMLLLSLDIGRVNWGLRGGQEKSDVGYDIKGLTSYDLHCSVDQGEMRRLMIT